MGITKVLSLTKKINERDEEIAALEIELKRYIRAYRQLVVERYHFESECEKRQHTIEMLLSK